MIQLAEMAFEVSALGRSWDLTEHFAELSSSVRLYEMPFKASPPSDHGCISRSYSGKYAAEIYSDSPCGIDIEIPSKTQPDWSIDSPTFQMAILAPNESALITNSEFRRDPDLETLIWASKEALAKTLGNAQNYQPNQIMSPITWSTRPVANMRAQFLECFTERNERLIIWAVERF